MHVVMRHQISGHRDGVAWPERGETIELPDDEAISLIRGGAAIELADSPAGEIETAALVAPPAGLTKASGQ